MIRTAKVEDMEEIAMLHIESFSGHFLPKLGVELLSKFYKEFLTNDNVFLVHTDDNNKITGFILGTPSSAIGRKKFVRNNIFKLTLKVIGLCIKFDKDTLQRVKGLKKLISTKANDNNKEVVNKSVDENLLTRLSTCVSNRYKGKGIAKLLVEEFEKKLLEVGYSGYKLTVQKKNSRAIGFNEKLGMNIYKETDLMYGMMKIVGGSKEN